MVDSVQNNGPRYGAPILLAAAGGLGAGFTDLGKSKMTNEQGIAYVNSDKFVLSKEATPEQKTAYNKIKNAKASTDPVKGKTTGAAAGTTATDSEIEKEVNKIFGKKEGTEKSIEVVLGGDTMKTFASNLKAEEQSLTKSQKAHDDVIAKHEDATTELEKAKENYSKESQNSIKKDEVRESGAKTFKDEAKKAKDALDTATTAEKKALGELDAAKKELVDAKTKLAATPGDKALEAEVKKAETKVTGKQKTYDFKKGATAKAQSHFDLKTIEATTAEKKAALATAQDKYEIEKAKDPKSKATTDADTELKKAKKEAGDAIDAELAKKKDILKDANSTEKAAKTAMEKSEKSLAEKTLKFETRKAKLNLAKAAKESGTTKISREAFSSELSTGMSSVKTKIANPLEKALEALKLPKKLSGGKVAAYAAGGLALGLLFNAFTKPKAQPEPQGAPMNTLA